MLKIPDLLLNPQFCRYPAYLISGHGIGKGAKMTIDSPP